MEKRSIISCKIGGILIMAILSTAVTLPGSGSAIDEAKGFASSAEKTLDLGACCVDFECVGNFEEDDCLAFGGIWHEDEDCDSGFDCSACGFYVVGDYNGDGNFDVADIVEAFDPWHHPPALLCECPPGSGNVWPVAMDLNMNCHFNLADLIWGYGFLKGQPNTLMPCPECPPGLWRAPVEDKPY